MAASDHLEPKLFHGTGHWFAPGDIVNPGADRKYPHGDPGAYASTDFDDAAFFSNLKRQAGPQPALFAPVYEVEHLTEHSDPLNKLDETSRRDTKGFSVKKLAGYSYHYVDHGEK